MEHLGIRVRQVNSKPYLEIIYQKPSISNNVEDDTMADFLDLLDSQHTKPSISLTKGSAGRYKFIIKPETKEVPAHYEPMPETKVSKKYKS